jgi:hypothetical protein
MMVSMPLHVVEEETLLLEEELVIADEETLVIDVRSQLRPSEVVERRLVILVGGGPPALSKLVRSSRCESRRDSE